MKILIMKCNECGKNIKVEIRQQKRMGIIGSYIVLQSDESVN